MPADLNKLTKDFKNKIVKMIDNCKTRGIDMRPYDGLRNPQSQGKLWRQSRSTEQITKKTAELKAEGADFLASCIEKAGPQSGPNVTNAIPGYSWHQWGEAVDLFWLVNGEANWSTTQLINGKNGYHVMAEEAVKLGLDAGLSWTSFPDAPHIQLRADSNPGKIYTIKEINDKMKTDFGA
jgi:peptidoglycan L-alanyl-D-glutamate endopeptidase CwlK